MLSHASLLPTSLRYKSFAATIPPSFFVYRVHHNSQSCDPTTASPKLVQTNVTEFIRYANGMLICRILTDIKIARSKRKSSSRCWSVQTKHHTRFSSRTSPMPPNGSTTPLSRPTLVSPTVSPHGHRRISPRILHPLPTSWYCNEGSLHYDRAVAAAEVNEKQVIRRAS